MSKKKSKADETVRVVVRCRPFAPYEKQKGCKAAIRIDRNTSQIYINNKTFTFDNVFDANSTQWEVYEGTAMPIVSSVLNGYNGTIFAYGQTGSGKTYTMQGVEDSPDLRGLIPNAFNQIFRHIEISTEKKFLVRASYLEIYNEDIRDLLAKNKNPLELKEHPDNGVYVKNLTSFVVKSVEEIEKIMTVGAKNRAVGDTAMNEKSSRSHSIFQIHVECFEEIKDGQNRITAGKLNMVDLAGSERASKTGASGSRLKEGCKINLSLSALGNVISALVDSKTAHIPYRDSKLTRLLQDSLGGNTRTVMVANCSPADYNGDETLSTLRYADRAKRIKNKPVKNEDPKDAMIREFQEEIARLRAELENKSQTSSKGDSPSVSSSGSAVSDEELKRLQRQAEEEKEKIREQMQARSEEERKQLVERQQKNEEERERIEEELKRRRQELEKEKVQREELSKKIEALEGHVVPGGKDLLDENKRQAIQLATREEELQRKHEEQLKAQKEKEEEEEARLLMEQEYKSLQEEVQVKTKKLKKLWEKYQASKTEIEDLREEFQRDKDDYLYTIREADKEQKLLQTIIDHFIPPEFVELIRSKAHWNEDDEQWKIEHADLTSNYLQRKRPQISPHNSVRSSRSSSSSDGNQKQKTSRNFLQLGLEMPERTTEDYEPPVDPQVQKALNAAMGEDEDSTFVASENLPNVYLTYSPEKKEDIPDRRPSRTSSRRSHSRIRARR